MTIGIYFIRHVASGRMYIGKSVNVERRLIAHKHHNTKIKPNNKHVNRYLYSAVQKYGWGQFETGVIESFDQVNERLISERELYWIDFYNTTDTNLGFNLRRDSSSGMVTHESTKKLQSAKKGNLNPNYGNKWSEEQKRRMSDIAKKRHESGKYYGEEWRKLHIESSRKMWADDPEKMHAAIGKMIPKLIKYKIHQFSKDGEFIRTWARVSEILSENPGYKRHNIYAVCSGEKPTMYGYIWRKERIS